MKDRNDMTSQSAHPLAGASMTGAEMVVQVLADEGVNTIFGYSGGAILPIYDAVFRYNMDRQPAMPLIVPANEQGAGFMAAGFARARRESWRFFATSAAFHNAWRPRAQLTSRFPADAVA